MLVPGVVTPGVVRPSLKNRLADIPDFRGNRWNGNDHIEV